MANPELEQPFWYGKHDNLHHDGMRAHLRKIASAEEDLFETTGIKGKKRITLRQGKLSTQEILFELMEGIEPST